MSARFLCRDRGDMLVGIIFQDQRKEEKQPQKIKPAAGMRGAEALEVAQPEADAERRKPEIEKETDRPEKVAGHAGTPDGGRAFVSGCERIQA